MREDTPLMIWVREHPVASVAIWVAAGLFVTLLGTAGSGEGSFAILAGAFTLYMTPYWICEVRAHPRKRTVSLVCLFFGWTIIGWIIALIWSVGEFGPVSVD